MIRLLLLILTISTQALALETAPITTARDTASLVTETDSFTSGKPLRLGLHLKLAPGWHTYWSNPGDAGAPPELNIKGATPIAYPAPERLQDGPFTSFAYTGEVLLPVTITPSTDAKTLSIDATANWLVCAHVCVPEDASFHLEIPAGPAAPGAQAPLFAQTDARSPRASPFPAHITPQGVLWLEAPHLSLRSAYFFPSEAGLIDQGAMPAVTVRANRIELPLKLLKTKLTKLSGVLMLTDAGGQVSTLAIEADSRPLPAQAARSGLLQALLFAFAGGLILNLMPCVLPVLAIKALALSRLSGAKQAHVRAEAAFYTAGVLVAFCAIGGITIAARALGDQAGWGAQFQSAAFTTAMAWLLFATGLNLSGVFEVGAGLAGTGQSLAARGSFFTGLLAVVVATPCTAPFMGAALAAALAMPAAEGMLIFVFLGLGLAAPYLALALNPKVARFLPKPGAWMAVFKSVLAFPMYGAALWMVWVTSQQTGPVGLAAVFASLLCVAFAAWAYGFGQSRDRAALPNSLALASFAGACALVALVILPAAPAASATGVASDGSEPYSAKRLAELRAAHRPVLVDMSAAWCVTCLVNEQVALAPANVRAAFAEHHVAYLKGDWTRQDAAITSFLRDHDRDGVPLYVYYPIQGAPEILPQILTPAIILSTITP